MPPKVTCPYVYLLAAYVCHILYHIVNCGLFFRPAMSLQLHQCLISSASGLPMNANFERFPCLYSSWS